MIETKRCIIIFPILAAFSFQFTYSQTTNNIVVTTNNNVHGISVSAKANIYKKQFISINTKITNKLSNALDGIEYKIEFIGANGKILKDTVIHHNNAGLKNPYPEYLFSETEENGKIKIDTFLNQNYYDYFDSPEYKKGTFLIMPKAAYSSEVILQHSGIYSIRIKPIRAKFGFTSYHAPGY